MVSRLEHASRPLTREDAAHWKRNLAELIRQGPAGALAIAEFLSMNTDVIFGRAGRELVGFDSAREALFDALLRIGGAEGVAATLQALRESADPREIALLARNLDTLAPDVHRHEAVSAARGAFAMAEKGELTGVDVAPLFEVLQHYGGPEVVADLERVSSNWEYYSAIALAHLPDGVGVPSLVQMAEQDGPSRTTALQLLAQLSGDHTQAGAALAAQVQANKIPQQTWPFLVAALAGNEYFFQNTGFIGPEGRAHPGNVSAAHVSSGNQSFYNAYAPGSLTREQINQRIAFIDQLRALTSQPTALQALQGAVELLMKRLPNTAATSP